MSEIVVQGYDSIKNELINVPLFKNGFCSHFGNLVKHDAEQRVPSTAAKKKFTFIDITRLFMYYLYFNCRYVY